MSEYKLRMEKGITDLKGQLPKHGATDWWTEEQWAEWNRTLPEKLEWNKKYIEQCKADGTYGEEYFITINLQDNPLFDAPQLFLGTTPFSSYKMVLLDPSQNNET